MAFRLHEALGTQNERYFVAATPPAHSLACLRIDDPVTAAAARLATGVGELAPHRTGFAPVGRRTKFHDVTASSLPFDQPCLVAPCTNAARRTRCAGLRPGPLDTPAAAAKHTRRALARRWITLDEEIATHDRHLVRLTIETAPALREGFGVGAGTAAEMLILFGDTPDRIRSEAAFAKLCGACPIPASSGRTTGRHRLYRGGHRHANAALYRAVLVRMRFHQPTVEYVARRTADGRTKREIIRCLKRFLAREIYQRVMTDFRTRQHVTQAA